MKPFDLEAAKRGEPIVTRDGREAKFIAHVPELNFPVLVLLDVGLWQARKDGTSNVGVHVDLFMAPKKRTVWVNLYPPKRNGVGITGVYWCDSEDEADKQNDTYPDARIGGKAYPVEIEE